MTRISLTIAAAMIATGAGAEELRFRSDLRYDMETNKLCSGDVCIQGNWRLITQTYGGQMQLVKNLTEKECRFMEARALGKPATDEERKAKEKEDADWLASLQPCETEDIPPKHYARCRNKDGRANSYSYMILGDGKPDPNKIKSAECFE